MFEHRSLIIHCSGILDIYYFGFMKGAITLKPPYNFSYYITQV